MPPFDDTVSSASPTRPHDDDDDEKDEEGEEEDDEEDQEEEDEGENKQRNDALASVRAENLNAGRRFYYLIIAVALFFVVVLLENDPARVPVLQRAVEVTRDCKRDQVRLGETWKGLIELGRLAEQEIGTWKELSGGLQVVSTSGGWLDFPPRGTAAADRSRSLQDNVLFVWRCLETLKAVRVSPGPAITTDYGEIKVEIPTDRPTLQRRIEFIETLSSAVTTVLQQSGMRVIATAGVGETEVSFERTSARGSVPLTLLQNSKVFLRLAFLVNREKYGPTELRTFNRNLALVRASLVDLNLWDQVTRIQYNPSLWYSGSLQGKMEHKDDLFFNEVALDRVIAALQEELGHASKKLKIPLTSYEARADTTVLLTAFILVALYLAYAATLDNIAALRRRKTRQELRFYPWAVFWGVSSSQRAGGSLIVRGAVNILTVLHVYLGALVIGWAVVSMLHLSTSPWAEIIPVGACFAVALGLGVYCHRRIRRIQLDYRRSTARKPAAASEVATPAVSP